MRYRCERYMEVEEKDGIKHVTMKERYVPEPLEERRPQRCVEVGCSEEKCERDVCPLQKDRLRREKIRKEGKEAFLKIMFKRKRKVKK